MNSGASDCIKPRPLTVSKANNLNDPSSHDAGCTNMNCGDLRSELDKKSAVVPRLTIYCVAYKRYDKIPVLVYSLMCQTYKDFKLVVIHDGEDMKMHKLLNKWKNIYQNKFDFMFTKQRFNDYGHSLRAMAIEQCDSTFIMLTNDDNYYVPVFLEHMFHKVDSEDLDFVLCDMVHSHERPGNRRQGSYRAFVTKPWANSVDIGCFLVKTELAKTVGFRDKTFGGDATFVEDIMHNTHRKVKWGKVDKILFVHN